MVPPTQAPLTGFLTDGAVVLEPEHVDVKMT